MKKGRKYIEPVTGRGDKDVKKRDIKKLDEKPEKLLMVCHVHQTIYTEKILIKYLELKMHKKILEFLYHWSSKINVWAWNKLYANRDPDEWIKGYRKWKKHEKI